MCLEREQELATRLTGAKCLCQHRKGHESKKYTAGTQKTPEIPECQDEVRFALQVMGSQQKLQSYVVQKNGKFVTPIHIRRVLSTATSWRPEPLGVDSGYPYVRYKALPARFQMSLGPERPEGCMDLGIREPRRKTGQSRKLKAKNCRGKQAPCCNPHCMYSFSQETSTQCLLDTSFAPGTRPVL